MMAKKLLLEIRQDQKDIKKLLDPSIVEKARKYDELVGHLRNVKLAVGKVSVSMDEDGYQQVIVMYEPITEKIHVESEGKLATSKRFKAINFLDLINLSDMKRISAAIDEAKSKANS